jgi:nicotinamide-nucleotide amidase
VEVELLAVGSELLLGELVDTNSAWLGSRLEQLGLDCHRHVSVGDNLDRIAGALEEAAARADAVVVSGGLGPTQDDLTRDAIARAMGAPLEEDPRLLEAIEARFRARGRPMPAQNRRQALVPKGAAAIPNRHGTAPGVRAPLGGRCVIYALPGVPTELRAMFDEAVAPDLLRRSGSVQTLVPRTLRVAGLAESAVAERLGGRFEALEGGPVTMAFLASGIEGIKVRLRARAPSRAEAEALLDREEAEVRSLLGEAVFGVDEETMEQVVAGLLVERGLTLALGESLTGGLAAARLVSVSGASAWFRGSVVAYQPDVKWSVLGVPEGPVVSLEAAAAIAEGARRVLGADVGLAFTGVAGPEPSEGEQPGTVFVALAGPGTDVEPRRLSLGGDRDTIRGLSVLSGFDLLRRRLLSMG